MDQAKILTSQIAIRSYYSGEAAGFRFVGKECRFSHLQFYVQALIRAPDSRTVHGVAPHDTSSSEISELRRKLGSAMADIRSKNSSMTIQELRRILYRCAAVLNSLDYVSFYC